MALRSRLLALGALLVLSSAIFGQTIQFPTGAGLLAPTDDSLIVGNGTVWQLKLLADCDDAGGNHLNYDTTTNVFSCGTSGGGAGAPTDAGYWVDTANATLSAERNLGGLTTGLVLNTVAAGVGVPSAYAGTSCTNQFPRSVNASGAATCATVGITDTTNIAPADATYWTGSANATLSAEQSLAGITALVVSTAGTPSAYAGVTCTNQFLRILSVLGAGTCASVSLTADVTGDLPYANLVQATGASLLVGRGSAAGAGDFQEITLGSGLTMTGTSLSSSGGAPTDATYLTQTAHASLSAEQALEGLASGIMRVATATGVVTSLTTSAGISANLSDETGSGALAFGAAPTFTSPTINTTLVSTSLFAGFSQGRLTLTSGTAVTTSDVTGATTIYYTPYAGNLLALYDGSTKWTVYPFTEISLALGTLTSDLPYDVFVYDNAGTPTLESLAWTNPTTRATALVLQNGVLSKTGALTRRYLGTFYTTTTTTTEDSYAKRMVWNYNNRVPRAMRRLETTTQWTYTTATVRQANAATANQLEVMVGWAEVPISVRVHAHVANSSAAVSVAVGIGEDSTGVTHSSSVSGVASTGAADQQLNLSASLETYPAVGRHFYSWLEWSQATGTSTWFGDRSASAPTKAGIVGWIMG